ncbi:MAG: nuclear transport factor 2 family protein [Desulfuromonadales bacterium]|nr:nuclear transport factor 2 family protein [Desulfuromonadales bacterium]
MKTLCFALATVAAHLPTHAAAADEPRAVVEAAYEALAQGDMDRFAGLMAPDIVWNEAEGNPYADLNPYELKVTLGLGEVEPLHSHRWPSVLHIQQAGHFLDRDAEDNVIFDSREAPPLELPLTMWKGPEAPHSPVNLSEDTEIRLIRIELKQAPTP